MTQPFIVALSALVALIGTVTLVRALRASKSHWNVTSSFLLTVSILLIWTTVIGSATGAASYTTDVFYNRVSLSEPWLDRLREITSFAIVALSALFVVRGIRRRIPINGPALILMGAIVVGQLATGLAGDSMFTPRTLALLAIVGASAFADRGRSALLGIATFGVAVAIFSTLMPLFAYDASVIDCFGKCGALGFVFAGALSNGNALGLVLTLALPAVYLAFDGAHRWVLVGFLSALIASSASRTSVNAMIVLLVVLVILRPGLDRPVPRPRKLLLASATLVAAAISVIVPFVTTDLTAYTGRGYLWQLTFQRMQGNELVGLGTQSWGEMTLDGTIAQTAGYSTHNQWLDVWYVAGWIGLVLFVLFVAGAAHAAGNYAWVLAVVALPAAVIAITERPWSISTIDSFTFSLLAFMLAAPAVARMDDGGGRPATAAPGISLSRQRARSRAALHQAR